MIGFDTETCRFTTYQKVPRVVCVSLSGKGSAPELPGWVHQEDGQWVAVVRAAEFDPRRHLFDLADNDDGTLIGHFTAYDIAVIGEQWGVLDELMRRVAESRIKDTQVRERLLRLAFGQLSYYQGRPTKYSLADLVWRYFDEDISEEKKDPNAWRLRYRELEDEPIYDWPRDALEYAGLDAYWPLELHDAQIAANSRYSGEYPVHDGVADVVSEDREVAAQLSLYLESAWGFITEKEAVDRTLAAWQADADRGRRVGEAAGFVRVRGRDKGKPGSVNLSVLRQRIAWAFGGEENVEPAYRSDPSTKFPNGQIKYDADTLSAAVALSGDSVLDEYAKTIQHKNWLSKYAPALRRGTLGPIMCKYDHLKETGRTSAMDPPIQQPPRSGGYRECHVPRPGFWFAASDYDFVELCTLGQAQLWAVGSSRLAEVINAGRDPHLNTAMIIMQSAGLSDAPRTYEEADERKKAGDPAIKQARQDAKAVNFGLPGMMGNRKFIIYAWKQYRVKFTMERAQETREAWLSEYREQRVYWAWVDQATAGGSLRQFVSGRVRGEVSGPAAANSIFQGLAADGAKYAAWLLAQAAYTGHIYDDELPDDIVDAAGIYQGCRPIFFLHDEVIAEVPRQRAAECAEAQAKIMRYAMKLHVPDVKIGCKPVLMKRWYKGLDATYDGGVLVPTEPRTK